MKRFFLFLLTTIVPAYIFASQSLALGFGLTHKPSFIETKSWKTAVIIYENEFSEKLNLKTGTEICNSEENFTLQFTFNPYHFSSEYFGFNINVGVLEHIYFLNSIGLENDLIILANTSCSSKKTGTAIKFEAGFGPKSTVVYNSFDKIGILNDLTCILSLSIYQKIKHFSIEAGLSSYNFFQYNLPFTADLFTELKFKLNNVSAIFLRYDLTYSDIENDNSHITGFSLYGGYHFAF